MLVLALCLVIIMTTMNRGEECTFVVGDVWIDVVLNEDAHEVVAPHLARVTQRRSAGCVLKIHVGAFAQQQHERFTASLLLLQAIITARWITSVYTKIQSINQLDSMR